MLHFDSNLPLLKRVMLDYFRPDSPIIVKYDCEGQMLDKKGRFVIGCKAGPSYEVENLLHEMAHFAEREINQLKKKPHCSWGYSFGKHWEVLNKSGYEPQTFQSLTREQRVWAFQLNLHRLYGLNDDPYELTGSAQYVNSYFNYKLSSTPLLSDKEALDRIAKETIELSQVFTLQRFNKQWFERIEALKVY